MGGECFPTDTSTGAGLWQLRVTTAENPLYAVESGCDTFASMTNPCCNALKAKKVVDYACIENASEEWAGPPVQGASPFCQGQWTGLANSATYYEDNNANAQEACNL